MSHKLIHLVSFLCVTGLVLAAFCLDFPAVAGSRNQNANSSVTTAPEEANMNMQNRRPRRPPTAVSAETTNLSAASTTEQTDLSGTYTGTFNCPDAGVDGETTLTITGNTFTLTDGKSGRIVAATTRGYTGVTMQFGELMLATPTEPGSAPIIVSMRARRSGDRLTLTTVPNAGRVCSFTPKR